MSALVSRSTELALTDQSGTLDAPTASRAIDGFIAALADAERPDLDNLQAALEAAAAWVSKLLNDSLDVHVSIMFAKRAFYARARELGVLNRYVHRNYMSTVESAIDASDNEFEQVARTRITITLIGIGAHLRREAAARAYEEYAAQERRAFQERRRAKKVTREEEIARAEVEAAADVPQELSERVADNLAVLKSLSEDRVYPIDLPRYLYIDGYPSIYQSSMQELDAYIETLFRAVNDMLDAVHQLRANADLIRERVGNKTIGEALVPSGEQPAGEVIGYGETP